MGWMHSDTHRLKDNLNNFSSATTYHTTPKVLTKTIVDKGTTCLLGEANCEHFLKDCVLESSRKNSKVFVPFKAKEGLYLDALVEAGMLAKSKNGTVIFTTPGIAWLCHKYRL